jgi:predicted MPP superfamily phosphohydrolase
VIQGVLGGRFVPPEQIAIELARLRAPAGVVAVLGNHDGWFDHERVRHALTLTLAGHTHGGQVRVPFAGALVVPSRFGQRFAAGHVVEGGRHVFVATGIGTSILPVRFRVPPTVTVIKLGNARAE